MILSTLSSINRSGKDRMLKRQFIDFIWLWRHGDVRRYWEGLFYPGSSNWPELEPTCRSTARVLLVCYSVVGLRRSGVTSR
jgi:hypothetical protein